MPARLKKANVALCSVRFTLESKPSPLTSHQTDCFHHSSLLAAKGKEIWVPD
jgi:hypothetical protein